MLFSEYSFITLQFGIHHLILKITVFALWFTVLLLVNKRMANPTTYQDKNEYVKEPSQRRLVLEICKSCYYIYVAINMHYPELLTV